MEGIVLGDVLLLLLLLLAPPSWPGCGAGRFRGQTVRLPGSTAHSTSSETTCKTSRCTSCCSSNTEQPRAPQPENTPEFPLPFLPLRCLGLRVTLLSQPFRPLGCLKGPHPPTLPSSHTARIHLFPHSWCFLCIRFRLPGIAPPPPAPLPPRTPSCTPPSPDPRAEGQLPQQETAYRQWLQLHSAQNTLLCLWNMLLWWCQPVLRQSTQHVCWGRTCE